MTIKLLSKPRQTRKRTSRFSEKIVPLLASWLAMAAHTGMVIQNLAEIHPGRSKLKLK